MIFARARIRRRLAVVTKALYSGEYDFRRLIAQLGNSDRNPKGLICDYLIVEAVANRKKERSEIDIHGIRARIRAHEAQFEQPDMAPTLMELLKKKAERAVLEARVQFEIEALAPELSFHGAVFRAERNKGGPLTYQETEKLRKLCEELSDVQSQIEAHGASHGTPHVEVVLNDIKEELESRKVGRRSEVEAVRCEMRQRLIERGLIPDESTFFPSFTDWYSVPNHQGLEEDEAMAVYCEKLEEAWDKAQEQ